MDGRDPSTAVSLRIRDAKSSLRMTRLSCRERLNLLSQEQFFAKAEGEIRPRLFWFLSDTLALLRRGLRA